MLKKILFTAALVFGFTLVGTVQSQAKTNIIYNNSEMGDWCVHISDVSGKTNLRNSPNGKVCMRLYEWTDYDIYVTRNVRGWLQISSIYNRSRGYWVRLHGSRTGYWISSSIVY